MSSDLADAPTGACHSRVALAQQDHHGQQEHLEDEGRGQGGRRAACQHHPEEKPSVWPTCGWPRLTAADWFKVSFPLVILLTFRFHNNLYLNLVSGRIRIFHGVNFVCKAPPWWAVSNYCRGLETSPLSHMTTKIWDQKETQLSSTADLRYWPQLLDDSFARDLNSWGLNIVPHHLTILCQTLHWSLLLST